MAAVGQPVVVPHQQHPVAGVEHYHPARVPLGQPGSALCIGFSHAVHSRSGPVLHYLGRWPVARVVGMATHVALLRGINVGGRNKVAMADLREIMASLGHTDVATYIQSGNVVFSTDEKDTATLAAAIEKAVEDRAGVRSAVLVLTRAELARIARDNPYPDEPNLRAVHVVFLPAEPAPEMIASVAEAQDAGGAGRGAGTPPSTPGVPCSCTPRTASGVASWPRC